MAPCHNRNTITFVFSQITLYLTLRFSFKWDSDCLEIISSIKKNMKFWQQINAQKKRNARTATKRDNMYNNSACVENRDPNGPHTGELTNGSKENVKLYHLRETGSFWMTLIHLSFNSAPQ